MNSPMKVNDKGEPFLYGKYVFQGTESDFVRALTLGAPSEPRLIVTPNVDQLIRLGEDADLRAAYDQASHIVVDGFPVLRFFRARGAQHLHRITGSDLIFSLSAQAAAEGHKVVITGGSGVTLEAAVARLREMYPQLAIEGVDFPVVDDVRSSLVDQVVDDIRSKSPQIVFLCLGSPKQEAFFLQHRQQLPKAFYLGVGAAVDFAAGTKSRAPRIVQKLGMEWCWRLIIEPRRLAHRYLIRGPRFLKVMMDSLRSNR